MVMALFRWNSPPIPTVQLREQFRHGRIAGAQRVSPLENGSGRARFAQAAQRRSFYFQSLEKVRTFAERALQKGACPGILFFLKVGEADVVVYFRRIGIKEVGSFEDIERVRIILEGTEE